MKSNKSIYFSVGGVVFSLGLILLAIVDFRRGFLFSKATYLVKTPFYVFTPLQLLIVSVGVAGVCLAWPRMKLVNSHAANALLIGIFCVLLIDAGLYRGIAASRALDAGKIGIDWMGAFGVTEWWRPLALCASYVLTVWHATVLSCLGAGVALLALPRILRGAHEQRGWRGSLSGTLYAFTQPFCSCCVAMTSPSLFRSLKSTNFALAVLLGAPLLNISTLILAGNLLPWPYATLRIFGGLVMTVILSFALSKWILQEPKEFVESREQKLAEELSVDSPALLLINWLRISGRIALILVPSMILGTILSSMVWNLWPVGMGNSFASVLMTAVIGSLVMVSTWSEIPLASQMIQQGLTGPAAAALIALPAVNLGSLLIIARVSRNWKTAAGLGVGVTACSVLAGVAFL